jgi:hypothetical protein
MNNDNLLSLAYELKNRHKELSWIFHEDNPNRLSPTVQKYWFPNILGMMGLKNNNTVRTAENNYAHIVVRQYRPYPEKDSEIYYRLSHAIKRTAKGGYSVSVDSTKTNGKFLFFIDDGTIVETDLGSINDAYKTTAELEDSTISNYSLRAGINCVEHFKDDIPSDFHPNNPFKNYKDVGKLITFRIDAPNTKQVTVINELKGTTTVVNSIKEMLPALQYYGFKIGSYQVLKNIKSSGRRVISKDKKLECFFIINHLNQGTLSASENVTFVIKGYRLIDNEDKDFLNLNRNSYLITKVTSAPQILPKSTANNKNQPGDKKQTRYERMYQKLDDMFWEIEPGFERNIYLDKYNFFKEKTEREYKKYKENLAALTANNIMAG